jgi:hypothetical protein
VVPDVVTEPVVDALEPVEVEEEHPDPSVGAFGRLDRLVEAFVEEAPVGQLGQEVVGRFVLAGDGELGRPVHHPGRGEKGEDQPRVTVGDHDEDRRQDEEHPVGGQGGDAVLPDDGTEREVLMEGDDGAGEEAVGSEGGGARQCGERVPHETGVAGPLQRTLARQVEQGGADAQGHDDLRDVEGELQGGLARPEVTDEEQSGGEPDAGHGAGDHEHSHHERPASGDLGVVAAQPEPAQRSQLGEETDEGEEPECRRFLADQAVAHAHPHIGTHRDRRRDGDGGDEGAYRWAGGTVHGGSVGPRPQRARSGPLDGRAEHGDQAGDDAEAGGGVETVLESLIPEGGARRGVYHLTTRP